MIYRVKGRLTNVKYLIIFYGTSHKMKAHLGRPYALLEEPVHDCNQALEEFLIAIFVYLANRSYPDRAMR